METRSGRRSHSLPGDIHLRDPIRQDRYVSRHLTSLPALNRMPGYSHACQFPRSPFPSFLPLSARPFSLRHSVAYTPSRVPSRCRDLCFNVNIVVVGGSSAPRAVLHRRRRHFHLFARLRARVRAYVRALVHGERSLVDGKKKKRGAFVTDRLYCRCKYNVKRAVNTTSRHMRSYVQREYRIKNNNTYCIFYMERKEPYFVYDIGTRVS